jgi:hypothetical protein
VNHQANEAAISLKVVVSIPSLFLDTRRINEGCPFSLLKWADCPECGMGV